MKDFKSYMAEHSSDSNEFNEGDLNVFLNEATTEGILEPGEAECFEKTFLALLRIGGRAAVFVIKTIVKLLKVAGVTYKGRTK